MLADLHTHSTASDGQYTPAELTVLAKKRGLEVLALTDHDSMDGLEEVVQAGNRLGLRVIRGIELSAKEYRNLHVLGYAFTPGARPLADLCGSLKAGREDRKERMIDFLRGKGIALTLAEVEKLAGSGNVGRPHFAQAMVQRGYSSTVQEAFDRYLDIDEFQQMERQKPSVRTCIETIKLSGGKTSLAHPYQLGLDDVSLEALVCRLVDYGLDAIECYYPKHTLCQQEFYLHLVRKYHLQATGGSDFHGERIKPEITLTAWPLDTEWICGSPERVCK